MIKLSDTKTVTRHVWSAGLTVCAALLLGGCGSEDDTYTEPESKPIASRAADLAQVSADNYDDNVNGLITGSTLKRWIDDWANNKPTGITGKLVILQASVGETDYEFIKPNGTNVFTYSANEWTETRSNGVIETPTMVPSGRTMDTFLAKYGIDPAKDMIVCAQGKAGQVMPAGRCWYMFRYWGTPKEHLAQLNGGNSWNGNNTPLGAGYFAKTGSTPPMNGTASVRDLPEINFVLQATLEDMMDVVPTQDLNLLSDGVFIWDARGNNLPTSLVTTFGLDGKVDNGGNIDEYSPNEDLDHRNSGATQGHPNGALLLSYTNLVDLTTGTYKSKDKLRSYLLGEEVDGARFVDGSLQGVGSNRAYQEGDTVYTYCETTMRAMVTGFASAAILGLPTRFYDGAMTEWHAMANVVPNGATDPILPWDSPWRTDKASWGMFRVATDLTKVAPRPIVNAYATTANAIINEDLAYKGITVDGDSAGGTDGDGGSSGGVTPPANPCG